MYRALLYQIIEDVPELQNLVEPEAKECYKQQGWPLELLKDLLRDALLVYGRKQTITCYIDALDECDEDEVREMLVSLEELGSETTAAGVEFSACLASRHYPNLRVSHLEEIVLNDRHGHQDDISRYVESKLNLQKVEQKLELASEIGRRSSGVFLWVVLVVAILNKLGAQGNVHQLQNRLQAIPTNLRELFDNILDRDESNENLVPMIQWTLFAGRRLSAIELYMAVMLCTSHSASTAGLWHKSLVDEQVLRDFILISSKGLLELSQVVQMSAPEDTNYGFIHESVREYFLDTGLQRLDPTLRGNVRATSQDRLARACTDHIPHLSALLDDYDSQRLPYLDYLRKYGALYHADRAELEGICQNDFCTGFALHDWFLICDMHSPNDSNLYLAENNATLLHVLVKHGYKNLARRELKRYLEFAGQHRPREAFANAQCKSRGTALHIAINDDENEMAFMLVANGFDVNAQVDSMGTPLVVAVNRQNTEVIQCLLTKGADSNISCGHLGTALHTLAHRTNLFLLFELRVAARAGEARSRTPDSNTRQPDFGSVYAFVDKTDMFILQLLLSNGADVNGGSIVWAMYFILPYSTNDHRSFPLS